MPVVARRMGKSISDGARQRIADLKQYPTLDAFRNPLTRSIARHFAHEAWSRTIKEIDFDFRMSDEKIGGVDCVHYDTSSSRSDNPLILYVHGGGFVCGSPRVNAASVLPICHLAGCEGVGIDYTLLPEAAYPKQIEEIDAVYRALLDKFARRKIILVADSAGGTLALSSIQRWRDHGVIAPAGAVFLSPLVDGAGASDTHITADGHDPLIKSDRGRIFQRLFQFYAPGQKLEDPAISPIYGSFDWLPPMLIHVGTREVLLGDSVRLAETARLAGVEATLRVFDGMFHLFHMHWSMPEARCAHGDIADFIRTL